MANRPAPAPPSGTYTTVPNPVIPSNQGTFTLKGKRRGAAVYVINGQPGNAIIGYDMREGDPPTIRLSDGEYYYRYRECTAKRVWLDRRWLFEVGPGGMLLRIRTYGRTDNPDDYPPLFMEAMFTGNA